MSSQFYSQNESRMTGHKWASGQNWNKTDRHNKLKRKKKKERDKIKIWNTQKDPENVDQGTEKVIPMKAYTLTQYRSK